MTRRKPKPDPDPILAAGAADPAPDPDHPVGVLAATVIDTRAASYVVTDIPTR